MDECFKSQELSMALFQVADHKTLVNLYPYYQLLDDRYVLEMIATAHGIPLRTTTYQKGIPKVVPIITSFYDLIFEMRLRDPIDRKTSCLSYFKMMIIAVKEQDIDLLKSLVRDKHYLCP